MYTTPFAQAPISYGGEIPSQPIENRSSAHLDAIERFLRFIKYFRRGETFYYRHGTFSFDCQTVIFLTS